MLFRTSNEVSLFLDIVQVIFTNVREKLPHDPLLKSSHNQFKLARRTNPKMIFNNIGTYMLVPFASAIEAGDFDALLSTITTSSIYLENQTEYAEFIEDLVFKPIEQMTPSDKAHMIKNLHTLTQLYVAYYTRKGVTLPLNRMAILTPDDLKATRSVVCDIMQEHEHKREREKEKVKVKVKGPLEDDE